MPDRRPAIFLDRDGVINENRPDYVKSWDELKFLPGVFDALRVLERTRFAVVVVTNQSAINRGVMRETALDNIHRRVTQKIVATGGRIDGIFYCPHRPDEGCACRKPRPGLLFQAEKALNLALDESFFVGDAVSDVEAAAAAGVQPLLVRTGRGRAQELLLKKHLRLSCPVFDDLPEAVSWILREQELNSTRPIQAAL